MARSAGDRSAGPVRNRAGLVAELRAVGVPDAETLRSVGAPEAARLLAELGFRDATRTELTLGALAEDATAPTVEVLGIDNVLFAVGDLDDALAHYATGLGLPLTFRLSDPPVALLRLGSEAPGLLPREDPSVPTAGPSVRCPRVWLEVADADAAAQNLRAAGLAVGEPFPVATGRVVEVADPWGNVVGLTDYSAAPERERRLPGPDPRTGSASPY